MSLNTRTRGRYGALAVAALALGGVVAAAPASADDAATEYSIDWGFKESFRNYVAGSMNPLPAGERIVPQAPATFDGAGTAETRPYRFPVAASHVADVDNLTVASAGGVTFDFPAHFFTVAFSDINVTVADGVARVIADLDIVVTQTANGFTAGEYHETGVHVADVGDLDVAIEGGAAVITGTDVTLTPAAAAYVPYADGDLLDDITVKAPVEDTWTPMVTVSKTADLVPGDTITINGWGYDPQANLGTRPPIGAGNPSGIYVVFGKFLDEWRPSEGATSEARTVIDQRWPLPEPTYSSLVGTNPQYVLLEADGSFSTSLVVTRDLKAAGNYGVYTYPAGGAGANAAHELAVPIALRSAAFVSQPESVSVEVGSTATFTVAAEHADALQWQERTGAGAWTDIKDATAATLEVDAASVALSGTQYRALATSPEVTAESAAATLTVTKATPGVKVAVKKTFRFASKRKATVTVDAPEGVVATGAVTIKAGKKVVGKGEVKDGKAVVTLTKKLRPGKANLSAEFAGNADLAAAKSPVAKVTVKKAAAKVTAKLAKKKVKVGKRATLRLKVTSANVKPGGKVKITITKGKKVRTLTVKVKAGKTVKVTLPKLAKGKYKVKAQYQGTKTVAKKGAKKVTLRVR